MKQGGNLAQSESVSTRWLRTSIYPKFSSTIANRKFSLILSECICSGSGIMPVKCKKMSFIAHFN